VAGFEFGVPPAEYGSAGKSSPPPPTRRIL
jgi:hypothetical protein